MNQGTQKVNAPQELNSPVGKSDVPQYLSEKLAAEREVIDLISINLDNVYSYILGSSPQRDNDNKGVNNVSDHIDNNLRTLRGIASELSIFIGQIGAQ